MKNVKPLPEVDKNVAENPILEPLARKLDFDKRITSQMGELDSRREINRDKFKSDIDNKPYLKRMDIILDANSYIMISELIDEILPEKINTMVEIIEEMIKVAEEKYVLKEKYLEIQNKFQRITENPGKTNLPGDSVDGIDRFIGSMRVWIESKLSEGKSDKTHSISGYAMLFRKKAESMFKENELDVVYGLIRKTINEIRAEVEKEEDGTRVQESLPEE